MSEFVQAYDPDHRCYRKIEVRSGEVVDSEAYPFDGIEEVEPLESRKARRSARQSDPLGAYR